MQKNKKKTLGILVCIPFILLPLYSYFIKGVFSWHISVPAYWNDAFEIGAISLIIFVLGAFCAEIRILIVLIVGGGYLASMGTLFQVVTAYAYLGGGMCMRQGVSKGGI